MDTPTAYFYSWPGLFLYVGQALDVRLHERHAMQVLISLEAPLRMRMGDADWQHYRAVLVRADQPYECSGNDCLNLSLNLDPETRLARLLQTRHLTNAPLYSLPDPLVDALLIQVQQWLPQSDSCQSMHNVLQTFFGQLTDTTHVPSIDDRIRAVQHRLATAIPNALTLAQLADEACLSEGRLVHLFKEQVGIPIRSYMLWVRLLRAIGLMVQGDSLTAAAHEAGFADSAHFSRTFTRMFGISPSLVVKNSQFIQVRLCG